MVSNPNKKVPLIWVQPVFLIVRVKYFHMCESAWICINRVHCCQRPGKGSVCGPPEAGLLYQSEDAFQVSHAFLWGHNELSVNGWAVLVLRPFNAMRVQLTSSLMALTPRLHDCVVIRFGLYWKVNANMNFRKISFFVFHITSSSEMSS